MKLNKFCILIFLFTSSISLYAQGGSNYSMFGLGDMRYSGSAFYEGLSGCGIALPSKSEINYINPALLSYSTKTRLQVGYQFNQQLVKTSETSIAQNNGKIEGFSGIFVIDTASGTALTLGLVPSSNVNYLIRTSRTYGWDTTSKITGTYTYKGTGGMSNAYFGGSTKLASNLSVGILGMANFGKITEYKTSYFDNSSSYILQDSKTYELTGMGAKIGLFYQSSDWGFGGYYETHSKLSVSEKYAYSKRYTSATTLDTVFNFDYDVTNPDFFGIGTSYKMGKYVLCGDFNYYNYKKLNFRTGTNTQFKDAYSISVALAKPPSAVIGAKISDLVGYNFGLAYRSLYYTLNNNDIKEYSASFGASVPIPQTALLDFALSGGMRGTKNNGLIQEYFLKFSVSLSIGENWFKSYYDEGKDEQ